LVLYATGLGPTRPALEPSAVFTAKPLQMATSPIEVRINNQTAEVLYAGGFPGSADGFQVNFRVPMALAPGIASLELTAAWIVGPAVKIALE
jgi:uncharacterized protein (TIGR03437 family)